MTLADIIRNKRLELRLTLEDVAQAVGVNRATILRWENGEIHKVNRDKIAALSKKLELDPMIFIRPAEILTESEHRLVTAYRGAEPTYQNVAMEILESHQRQDTDSGQTA